MSLNLYWKFYLHIQMSFISFLYTACLLLFILIIINRNKILINPWVGVIILIFYFVIFYRLYKYDNKFDEIIKNNDFSKKSNLFVILITFFAFLIINLLWIFKMLQNQGKI